MKLLALTGLWSCAEQSYIILNVVRLRGTMCSIMSLTGIILALTQHLDLFFFLLVLVSASTITGICIQNPVWPTCCILGGQTHGHWSAVLSLGLEWHISSCPAPGSNWNKSFRWRDLLETEFYRRNEAKYSLWTPDKIFAQVLPK